MDVASAELSADPLCMFVGSYVCLLAFGLFVSYVNKPEFIHCVHCYSIVYRHCSLIYSLLIGLECIVPGGEERLITLKEKLHTGVV